MGTLATPETRWTLPSSVVTSSKPHIFIWAKIYSGRIEDEIASLFDFAWAMAMPLDWYLERVQAVGSIWFELMLLFCFNLYKMTFLFFGLPAFLYHLRRSPQCERKSVCISFSSSFTHFLISCNCMKTFSLSYTGDSIRDGYCLSKYSHSRGLSQSAMRWLHRR